MVTQTMFPSAAANGISGADLARQASLYSLTLEEIQSAMNEPGKALGSMNMEEFLKNLWTAEESQAMVSASAFSAENYGLERLNSLSLPPSLSRKTVEDVWRDIQRHLPADPMDGQRKQKRQATLGEMTLEDFLSKAGAIRGEDPDASSQWTDGGGAMPLFSAAAAAGAPPPPPANGVPHHLPASMDPLSSPGLQADWIKFSSHHQHRHMLQQAEAAAAAAAAAIQRGLPPQGFMAPSVNPSLYDGLADSLSLGQEALHNTLDLSPPLSEHAMHGRKRPTSQAIVEKTMERRQKRMIKNRESAARSRARKQAYTVELEAEVAMLKEENARLRHQQALENCLPETAPLQQSKLRVLRRVRSW